MLETDNKLKTPLVLHARMMNGTGGGPDKTIINSPRFLKPLGFDCLCVFYRPPDDAGFDVIRKRAAAADAEIIEIDDGGLFDFSMMKKTVQLCRRRQVDIWHAHDYKTNLLGWIVSKFHKMRLITTAHGWVDFSGRLPTYYKYEKRWILPRYDKVICVSSSVMDQAIAGGTPAEKCLVIDNAIDNEKFARRRPTFIAKQQDFPESQNRMLIGAMGRLSAEKGFDLLINAVSKLIQEGVDAELVIAGEGSENENLQKLINELGIQDRARLIGFCQDTKSFYESLDLFVLSSHREGLPNVVLEAMAVGCPVVATEVDGVPRIINSGKDGILVPPGSAEHLRKGIKELATKKSERDLIAASGIQTIALNWSFKNRMEQIGRIYSNT